MKKFCYAVLFLLSVPVLYTQTIPVIDVSRKYPNASISLQDIADIEYVPLETSNNVLLDGNCKFPYVSDNYIVASNPRQGDVFLFGRDGKIKYQFNHRGNGPADYFDSSVCVFDEKNREVFIYSWHMRNPGFLVYSEDGKYKRTIQCSQLTNTIIEAINFDDDNLLIYDALAYKNIFNTKPYMLLSKKDGTVTSLNISLPQRIPFFIEFPDGTSIMYTPHNLSSDGRDVIIVDVSCDTIFQLKSDKSLMPLLRWTPPVGRTEPKIHISAVFKTEKFMILRMIKMPPQGSKTGALNFTLMYNFSNGTINEIVDGRFFDNDDAANRGAHRIQFDGTMPKNTLLFTIPAANLYEYREYIKGAKLKEIASTIDEEDNPVLLIAKFR